MPAADKTTSARDPGGRPPFVRNFYWKAFERARQRTLAEAQDVEGLDDEIATLRTMLLEAIGESPESFQLMLRGMDILARLLATRYRLSPRSEKDLSANLAALIRGFSEQFYLVSDDGA